MPHYADGTPAKQGDLVLRREKYENGTDLVGIILSIQPGSESCNAQAIPLAARQKGALGWLPIPGANQWCVTLSEWTKLGEVEPPPAAFDTAKAVDAALAGG